jgi:hypothetical protein
VPALQVSHVCAWCRLTAIQSGARLLHWRRRSAFSARRRSRPSAGWAAKLAIYLGFAVGIGGAFFRAWIAVPKPLVHASPQAIMDCNC